MTQFLFIDTETDGLTQNNLPPEHPAQPHLVQMGCLMTDDAGRELNTIEIIVRPEGYTIPPKAATVHGITTEVAESCGIPLTIAVALYTNLRARADVLVAHNLEFDDLVLRAAIGRTGRRPASDGPTNRVCTMRQSAPIVNLPPTPKMVAAGFTKPKPPSLTECMRFFFNEDLVGAHGALTDARACARVFHEIRRREAA